MIPWTVAHQTPLSTGFSRQEYCSGLPLPSPEDLPDPGIEPVSPTSQADSLPLSHLGSPSSMVNYMQPPKHAFLPRPRYFKRNYKPHSVLSIYQIFLRCICLSKVDLPAFYAFILATNKHLEKDGSRDRSVLNF